METTDSHLSVAQSIEHAMAHLAEALDQLDRIPPHDRSTIGYVAHAINNYLSVNDATLALIAEKLSDHPDPEVVTWMEGLHRLGAMMQHTLGRLLRASAPAEFPLKPEFVNLVVLMKRASDFYQSAAVAKQLSIVCRAVGDIPSVWADRVAVAVVADNLLSNAIDFSLPGGEILVQIVAGPGGVVCSVLDRGPGLTPLEQARLFARAVTAGPTPIEDESPAGFGLQIAKEFIDRMGGRLWSERHAGQGTCFYFRLPYRPEGSPAA